MNIVARNQSLILAGESPPPRRAVSLTAHASSLQRVTLVAAPDEAPILLQADFYPSIEGTVGLPTTMLHSFEEHGSGASRSSLEQYTAQGNGVSKARKGELLDVLA
jgi:hypothetical protein